MRRLQRKTIKMLYEVLLRIKKGQYANEIARELGFSKQRVFYYFKLLEQLGYIIPIFRSSFKKYEVTDSGLEFLEDAKRVKKIPKSSLGMRSKPKPPKPLRIHALAVKYPIIAEKPSNFKWEKEINLKNWTQKFYKIEKLPYNITLKKTTKHIVAYFSEIEADRTEFVRDMLNFLLRASYLIFIFLRNEANIEIDITRAEIINQHIASEEKKLADITDEDTYVEVDLKRKAKSVLPTNINAKSWIDTSKGDLELETNDLEYLENIILVGERVKQIHLALPYIFKIMTETQKSQTEEQRRFFTETIKVLASIGKNIEKQNELSNNHIHAIIQNSNIIKELSNQITSTRILTIQAIELLKELRKKGITPN